MAVVGMACRLAAPSEADADLDKAGFWQLLLDGKSAVRHIDPSSFHAEAWVGRGPGTICTPQAATLRDKHMVDWSSFGMTKREGRRVNLATLLSLEIALEALQDSGIKTRGAPVGVFIGGSPTPEPLLQDEAYQADEYYQTGRTACMLANRISHAFDLRGPSCNTDTACSASLTALHLAINSLRNKECSAALVASANLMLRIEDMIGFTAVVIKPLSTAVADGDFVYATILGTSINSNGRSALSLASPSGPSQLECIEAAWRQAGLSPSVVDYLELHATGTRVGDSIELNAAGPYFCNGRASRPLTIGSLKPNFGHTEYAASLVSLMKCVMILRQGVVPPQINFKTPSSRINWSAFNAHVPSSAAGLTRADKHLGVAALTSSGFGGANGHVVLQEYRNDALQHRDSASSARDQVKDSAHTMSYFSAQLVQEYSNVQQPDVSQTQLALSVARRARQMPWRCYYVSNVISNSPKSLTSSMVSHESVEGPLLVFAGQGPQHQHMGKSLYSTYSVFKRSIDELDEIYKDKTKRSLIHDYGLFGDSKATVALTEGGVWPVQIMLPALAALQMALFDLFSSWNLRASAVMGHSAGETAAMYACGAISRTMAMELAIARSTAMSSVQSREHGMAVVHCSAPTGQRLLAQWRASKGSAHFTIDLAAFNSPEALLVSGHRAALEELCSDAKGRGFFARVLPTEVPVHSSLMEACKSEYLREVTAIFDRHAQHGKAAAAFAPRIPFVSTVSGQFDCGPFTPAHVWRNARHAVQFWPALASWRREHGPESPKAPRILEMAPHPVLSAYIGACVLDHPAALCPLHRAKAHTDSEAVFVEELQALYRTTGQLLVDGHDLDLGQIFGGQATDLVKHPRHPLVREERPLLLDHTATRDAHRSASRPLHAQPGGNLLLSADTHPDLADHVIRGSPILPATGEQRKRKIQRLLTHR
ncbi:thiolase-like protein [Ceraceosorus guamensis]|uniref:Thiolase-like protein n=1 Tax=Ceraceosorus guamensis TaxID=1522189 RepID=A0A316VTB8_9BASI|nr:thiolase-like protein [Ceraceosorus guamensis]PWN40836.1 thiolase-like protein [Ceraceosorus guamensis]